MGDIAEQLLRLRDQPGGPPTMIVATGLVPVQGGPSVAKLAERIIWWPPGKMITLDDGNGAKMDHGGKRGR